MVSVLICCFSTSIRNFSMVYSLHCFFKLQCQKVSLHLEQLNEKHKFFIENYNNLEKKDKKYQFLHILLNMFLNICLLCLTWIHWIATVILQILSGKTWS